MAFGKIHPCQKLGQMASFGIHHLWNGLRYDKVGQQGWSRSGWTFGTDKEFELKSRCYRKLLRELGRELLALIYAAILRMNTVRQGCLERDQTHCFSNSDTKWGLALERWQGRMLGAIA